MSEKVMWEICKKNLTDHCVRKTVWLYAHSGKHEQPQDLACNNLEKVKTVSRGESIYAKE